MVDFHLTVIVHHLPMSSAYYNLWRRAYRSERPPKQLKSKGEKVAADWAPGAP